MAYDPEIVQLIHYINNNQWLDVYNLIQKSSNNNPVRFWELVSYSSQQVFNDDASYLLMASFSQDESILKEAEAKVMRQQYHHVSSSLPNTSPLTSQQVDKIVESYCQAIDVALSHGLIACNNLLIHNLERYDQERAVTINPVDYAHKLSLSALYNALVETDNESKQATDILEAALQATNNPVETLKEIIRYYALPNDDFFVANELEGYLNYIKNDTACDSTLIAFDHLAIIKTNDATCVGSGICWMVQFNQQPEHVVNLVGHYVQKYKTTNHEQAELKDQLIKQALNYASNQANDYSLETQIAQTFGVSANQVGCKRGRDGLSLQLSPLSDITNSQEERVGLSGEEGNALDLEDNIQPPPNAGDDSDQLQQVTHHNHQTDQSESATDDASCYTPEPGGSDSYEYSLASDVDRQASPPQRSATPLPGTTGDFMLFPNVSRRLDFEDITYEVQDENHQILEEQQRANSPNSLRGEDRSEYTSESDDELAELRQLVHAYRGREPSTSP